MYRNYYYLSFIGRYLNTPTYTEKHANTNQIDGAVRRRPVRILLICKTAEINHPLILLGGGVQALGDKDKTCWSTELPIRPNFAFCDDCRMSMWRPKCIRVVDESRKSDSLKSCRRRRCCDRRKCTAVPLGDGENCPVHPFLLPGGDVMFPSGPFGRPTALRSSECGPLLLYITLLHYYLFCFVTYTGCIL